MSLSSKKRLLAIVGPTAVGKTAAGMACARLLGGEIVSADSMQIYRGMDIGTAKPTAAERAGVPHHLIDIADPGEDFSVALYREKAQSAIDDIFARHNQPILVGGSGMYVRAVAGRWSMTGAPKDPAVRARLQEESQENGPAALHARLAEIDREAAAKISPTDEKRIIRALEVFETTGEPISRFHERDEKSPPKYDSVTIGLSLERAELYRRIEARVDRMMEAGLLEEVKSLRAKGYGARLISMKALGYSHLQAHLEGAYDLEAAVALIKRDTRRFAKRQLTWFRAEPQIAWVMAVDRSADDIAREIAHILRSGR